MGQSVASAVSGVGVRQLFGGQVCFVRGVTRASDFPVDQRPEVAVCGRSNVGKSSLINALVRRKALARSSKIPGRTRQFNYFDVSGRMYLVDLPGMGYASVPRKDTRRWSALSAEYFASRACLLRVLVLIDVRRGPGPLDGEVFDMLCAAAVPSCVVLTKSDTVPVAARASILGATSEVIGRYPAVLPDPILTSARTGEGIEELRSDIASVVLPSL